MRTLGWIAGGIVALLLISACAAWLIPPRLDWARYREEIADLASRQVGRTVRIDGPVTLSLLPAPVLTASRVWVNGDGQAARLGVQTLRVRVGLGALLAGRLDARELVLRGLDLALPWPLSATPAGLRAPSWLSAVSARIEQGRVAIGGVPVSDIDATLSADPLTATYQASGVATAFGRSWHFTARLSQPGADGSAGLDVALDGRGAVQGSGMTLTSQIAADGSLGGQFSARGPDLSQLLPAPKVPFRTDGRITVSGGLAAADDLAVEIGGSPGRGAVALRLSPSPRLDVALATSHLDLDAWMPTLTHSGAPIIATGIDLSAEAADLGGGVIRQLRAGFDLRDGAEDVRELRAVLPGDALFELAGRLVRDAGGAPDFSGDVRLAAPGLKTTMAWLANAGFGPLAALPDGVFRSAELAARVRVHAGTIAATDLTGRIDGERFAGSAAGRLGARFAVSLRLQTDRLDLDPWLPAQLPTPVALDAGLRAADVDVQVRAAHALARGLELSPLTLDAATDEGRIRLRALDFAARDVTVHASGAVLDGGRIADVSLDLRSSAAESLAAAFPPLAGVLGKVPALARNALSIRIAASGAPDAVAVRAVADLGDLHVEAQPTLDLQAPHWTGLVTVRHPGAPRLAESLGLRGAPAWLGDGSFSAVATLSGDFGHTDVSDFDVTAGALHATGHLVVASEAGGPHVSGRIAADTLPLPLPYPRSPDPLAFGALAGWACDLDLQAGSVLAGGSAAVEKLRAAVALKGGRLTIDKVSGVVSGGSLTGRAALDAVADPPTLAVGAKIAGASISGPLFDLPIDVSSGIADADVSLSAAGFSPRALLATARGSMSVHVRDGSVAGLSLPSPPPLSDADVQAAFAAGKTAFDDLRLTGTIAGGALSLRTAELRAAAGDVSLSGTVDIGAATADLRLLDRPAIADPPEIGLRLTGPLDALVRTPELARLAQWRVDRAATSGTP